MSREKYFKSFLSFSVGTWIRAILSLITTPVITFIISPQEFGKASMYGMIYSIFLFVVVLGTHQSYIRFFYEFYESDRSKLLWNCIWPSVIVGILVSVICLINWKNISRFIINTEDINLIILLILSLFTGVVQLFNMYSVRMKKMGLRYSLLEIVTYLTNFGGTVIYALLFGRNFYAIVFGQIIANIVTFLIGVSFEIDYWRPKKPDFEIIKKVIRYGLPFVPTFLLTWLFQSIDKITLRMLSTFYEIGLYTVAFKIANVMSIIQGGFTTFWIPVAYERYEKVPEDRSLYVKANEIIAATMFFLGSIIILGKDIVFLIVSKSYRSASTIVPFLILGPVMYTISETTVLGINFTKKTYWHFIISVITSLTNLLGNFALVPLYGARGAAISTGLSYVFFFALRTHISVRLFPTAYKIRRIYILTALVILQSFFATFFENTFINIGMGGIVLAFCVILYKDVLITEILITIKNIIKSLSK